ncbi:MAG: hypothetical protein WBK51_12240 [Polaromonas sp.]
MGNQGIELKMKKMFFVFVALMTFTLGASAQSCGLEKSGSLLSGTTYIASANLPPLSPQIAMAGIRKKLEASGQKILSSDLAQGNLQAEQPGRSGGRPLSISVNVRPVGNETSVAISIRLNPLQLSTDDAVKTELCAYVMAAMHSSQDVSRQSSASNETALQSTPVNRAQQNTNNEFIKNGFPCLSGVCIGDDITQIKDINWLSANPLLKRPVRPASESDLNQLRKQLIAPTPTLKLIASALNAYFFNADSIAALSGVQVACVPFKRYSIANVAYFTSQSGQLTTVNFEPDTKESNATQLFRVTSISRQYPNAVTEKQKTDLIDALRRSYLPLVSFHEQPSSQQGSLPTVEAARPPIGEGVFVHLGEPSNTRLNRADSLLKHPKCGGSTAIPIN